MTEQLISRDVLREITSNNRIRLFRNQMGEYELKDGRHIRSGLCPGSSDFVGWTTITVTKEMVGKKLAVFTAMEFKMPAALKYITNNYNELKMYNGDDKKKKRLGQQINFIERVRMAGGKAGFVSNIKEGWSVVE